MSYKIESHNYPLFHLYSLIKFDLFILLQNNKQIKFNFKGFKNDMYSHTERIAFAVFNIY